MSSRPRQASSRRIQLTRGTGRVVGGEDATGEVDGDRRPCVARQQSGNDPAVECDDQGTALASFSGSGSDEQTNGGHYDSRENCLAAERTVSQASHSSARTTATNPPQTPRFWNRSVLIEIGYDIVPIKARPAAPPNGQGCPARGGPGTPNGIV